MSEDFADDMKARMRAATRRALIRLGIAWKNEIRERIGIPVEGRGEYAIRSDPGEPPRKETGSLQDSVHYYVSPGFDFQSLKMLMTSPIGPILHFGTDDNRILPRPFWPEEPEVRQKRAIFKKIVAQELARGDVPDEDEPQEE